MTIIKKSWFWILIALLTIVGMVPLTAKAATFSAPLAVMAVFPKGTGEGQVAINAPFPEVEPSGPQALVVAPDGTFYVLDSMNNRVVSFSPKTGVSATLVMPQAGYLQDIVLQNGQIYLIDGNKQVVWQTDLQGNLGAVYAIPDALRNLASGMTVTAKGEVRWQAVNQAGSGLVEYSLAKLALGKISLPEKNAFQTPVQSTAAGLTVNAFDGQELRVSSSRVDTHTSLLKVTSPGSLPGKSLTVSVDHYLGSATLQTVDKAGNSYVLVEELLENIPEIVVDVTLRRYNPQGNLNGVAHVPIEESYALPHHYTAVAPDGLAYFLLVTEMEAQVVQLPFQDTYQSHLAELWQGQLAQAKTQPALGQTKTALAPSGVNQLNNGITRDQIIQNAEGYVNEQWKLSQANYGTGYNWSNCSTDNIWWNLPRYLTGRVGQTITAVPYAWGVSISLDEFRNRINQGRLAGDICTNGIPSDPWPIRRDVAGVDCSGFVSAVWNESYHTTYTLPDISTQINWQDLRPGDILNKTTSHVILFGRFVNDSYSSGQMLVYEANGTGADRVVHWTRSFAEVSNYTPRRYNNVIDNSTCTNPSPSADQAMIYSDINYCGGYVILNPGEWASADLLGIPNDTASSVKVGRNVQLTLCKDNDYLGGCENFVADDSSLVDNAIGNDQVSSAKLVRTKSVDINGDGKADIVGFGDAGVYVSLSNGSSFGAGQFWSGSFGYNAGNWRVEKHPRTVADVDGDGKADVVGFADDGVYVALSSGAGFGPMQLWNSGFSYNNGGWRVEKHTRTAADVNGDGKADVVGFADDGVYVALSNGTGFDPMQLWSDGFSYNNGGWRVEKHPRTAADVNGDGKADIVGFADDGVYVALSNGTGFDPMQRWHNEFGYNAGGWRVEKHPRTLADVNGDGKADVVGFGDAGVYVALSNGNGFGGAQIWHNEFGYDAGGWRVEKHPRTLADVNGDGKADIVGFGDAGVYVALSNGNGFGGAQIWQNEFGYDAGGWRVERHIRTSESGYGAILDVLIPVDPAFSKTFPGDSALGISASPTLSWQTSNGATDYQYCYDATNNNSCDGAWIDAGIQTNVALSGLYSNTTYFWQVKAITPSGEIYANNGPWWSFTTLVAGGEGYGASINGGAIFTNQIAVTLTLFAPAAITQMQISNDGSFLGAQWEPYAPIKPWTITQYGSYVIPRLVYVRYKDASGNISSNCQDDIILDVIPPTGTVKVNNFSSSQAQSYSVSLILSANDEGSGVGQMMISNQANFSGASWVPFSTTYTWTLDTSPTVYVRFKDVAGNISQTYSTAHWTLFLPFSVR